MNKWLIKRQQLFLKLIILITIAVLTTCTKTENNSSQSKETKLLSITDKELKNLEEYKPLVENKEKDIPLINMADYELVIKLMNVNIDLDSQDEQIIVYKNMNMEIDNIFIAIADFNNVKNSYERLWESITLAKNTLSVYIDDVIGDHDNEIICTGRDNQGKNTIDIFWGNDRGNPNKYISIFSTSAQGTIEINQLERSRAYFQGLKNGISYTINVSKETIENENKILIKDVYYWDFPQKKYLLLSTELIEYESIEEKQLLSVINGNKNNFYKYLSGPWSCEDKIIYFDIYSKNTVFYSNEIQESYSWQNTYKPLSTILFLRCSNEIINYIENEISVKIESYDEISITVRDIDTQTGKKTSNEIWTNNYTRMNNEMQNITIKGLPSNNDSKIIPNLVGQYINDGGDIIDFFGNKFFMKMNNKTYNGGYALYMSDVPILGMKIILADGTVAEDRMYKMDYTEEKMEQKLKRTITLTKGTLSVHGFKAYDIEPSSFVQIETIETESY